MVVLFLVFLLMPSLVQCEVAVSAELDEARLASIEPVVEKAVRDGRTPGAVVIIGQGDRVVYRRAFGWRSLRPERSPMAEDTIFDIASLTKAVATATAVMQLVEGGKIRLDAPAATYWPTFKRNGKAGITVRQLLTHYSGLRPDLREHPRWTGYASALKRIAAEKPLRTPGRSFIYSDLNYVVLGEIVRHVSGLGLDVFCRKRIFEPLGMEDTGFGPIAPGRRIAPTVSRNGTFLCGSVHDPSCYKMGGIAGHAGLFSTADDLAKFARMMLNGGVLEGARILKPETVRIMTSPQSPPGRPRLRGLGWDLEPPFAPGAGTEALQADAYGHLGYTGTALWIDPTSRVYIILLTNRVHANGEGDVRALRKSVKEAVSEALMHEESLSHEPEEARPPEAIPRGVRTGIDVLAKDGFTVLAGLRIGLITNHTGIDSMGQRTIDLLHAAPGVQLKAVFSPEHGPDGSVDTGVLSSRDRATGLPVYSLYGKIKKPTEDMLKDLDALVFDIQDAGARFYTYITTMGYAMEAAAGKGLAFYVLDRPNPITGFRVQGPVSDREMKSFTCYFPLPVRYGMTAGELAQMFNAERRIGAKLRILKMQGYQRAAWYDETGLAWVGPSPNLPSLTAAALYPGVALLEGANLSVGRGTPSPFEIVGAPWIDGERLARFLEGRRIPGVRFTAVSFTPAGSSYKDRLCSGIGIRLIDRDLLDAPFMGIEIISALRRLYPEKFQIGKTVGMIGSRKALEALREGRDPRDIAQGWQADLEAFKKLREKYLLYP